MNFPDSSHQGQRPLEQGNSPSESTSQKPLIEPVIASIAQLRDEEIADMSRSDLIELLRLSGQRFSTLDETQQLYLPIDRMQFFARLARDLCRQQISALQPPRLL